MTAFFFDTSALSKRYFPETSSPWVAKLIAPPTSNVVVVSELTTVEMFSVLTRLTKQQLLHQTSATELRSTFLIHAEKEYLTVPIERKHIVHSRDLVVKHGLRTLDAIQLASALNAKNELDGEIVFVSSDIELLRAASLEGFSTDDPHRHVSTG